MAVFLFLLGTRVARLILICESQRFLNIQDYHCCGQRMLSVARLSAVVQPFQGFWRGCVPGLASGSCVRSPGCLIIWRSEPAGRQERVRVSSCVLRESQGSGDREMGDCLSWQGCQNSASSLTSPAPGPGVCSVRAFVPRRKLLGSLASPQGTLIQHLKEHILHGNMTSSDIILYYTTVSALSGWALVHSGREAFIITLLFASPPLHVSIVRSTAQAAGCVPQTPDCMHETPGCVQLTPDCVQLTPGCVHGPQAACTSGLCCGILPCRSPSLPLPLPSPRRWLPP